MFGVHISPLLKPSNASDKGKFLQKQHEWKVTFWKALSPPPPSSLLNKRKEVQRWVNEERSWRRRESSIITTTVGVKIL